MATGKKSTKKNAAAARTPTGDAAAAATKFERDLLIRGDAAQRDSSGKLPLGATHEIVEEKNGDTVTTKIVRRRYNIS